MRISRGMIMDKSNNFNELKKKFLDREFSNLNDPQRESVFRINGNLLILAGAGSGKTTVIINRIYNMLTYGDSYFSDLSCDDKDYELISQGFDEGKNLKDFSDILEFNPVAPENILAITFTNKAAKEIKNRLQEKLGDLSEKIWASTFHSTCVKILRENAELLGYNSRFAIYDADDQKRLVKECQKALNIDDKSLPLKFAISKISNAKDEIMSPADFSKEYENDFKMSKVSSIYSMYQEKLLSSNAMDFDDLIYNTVMLFKNNKKVLDHYKKKFKYIMVDEYQDTSKAQHEFIKVLAGKTGNLCVVGDDDQSIYKFRGANIDNILTFDKYFRKTKVIRLEQNYRSTKNILDAANSVISNNLGRKSKKLWTESAEGEKIHLYVAYSEHDEAGLIASQILKKVDAGRNYSDFAILYRAGSQSGVIEKLLTRNGIPYRIVGNVKFFDRKEIKDLISYLSVINNTKNEVRIKRIINRPNRSIGDRTILAINKTAKEEGKTFYDIVRTASQYSCLQRASGKVLAFAALMDSFIEKNENGCKISEIYQSILDKTGYLDFIRATEDDPADKIDNVKELGNFISKFEEDHGDDASLDLFLEETALLTDSSVVQDDESKGCVTLMTIHASKGLEFPVVFLPGMEEGIFPGVQSVYDDGDIEEERRLAYVALTRAKEELIILNATSRMTFGTTSHNKPSRFVTEIPEDLIETTRSRDWKKLPKGSSIPVSNHSLKVKSVVSARSFGAESPFQSYDQPEPEKSYSLGDSIDHSIFGHGTITSVYDVGTDLLLEIDFVNSGKKKILNSVLEEELVY